MKSRSKIALFSNEHHFEIWFPKKKTIMFFWSKLSKLHKKDPILHVATTFSLKQGETRITCHGPIPHPLIWIYHHHALTLLHVLPLFSFSSFLLLFFLFFFSFLPFSSSSSYPNYINVMISSIFLVISWEQCSPLPHFIHPWPQPQKYKKSAFPM